MSMSMSDTMAMGTGTMSMPMPSSTSGSMGMGMGGMGMGGMDMSMGMAMTFFNAIDTPLYSNAWTPSSTGTYAGTCIFLIALAAILRGLFAFKHLLEQNWARKAAQRRYIVVASPETDEDDARNRESIAKSGLTDVKFSTAVLTTNGLNERVKIIESPGLMGPSNIHQPWRLSVDLPRALLVGLMVALGYLLMLAVMTYNIGYFLSVCWGSFLGELLVGRFHVAAPDHAAH